MPGSPNDMLQECGQDTIFTSQLMFYTTSSRLEASSCFVLEHTVLSNATDLNRKSFLYLYLVWQSSTKD